MQIIKYEENERVEDAIKKDEPLMAVISFSADMAIVSHIDEAIEHHILLNKAGFRDIDVDKYFRVIFDKQGCDWTFIAPPDYKNIKDKEKRIKTFYNDGFKVISSFLSQMNYCIDLKIPKRYRRHLEIN